MKNKAIEFLWPLIIFFLNVWGKAQWYTSFAQPVCQAGRLSDAMTTYEMYIFYYSNLYLFLQNAVIVDEYFIFSFELV